ncbi:MAG: hypothetical protein AB7P21_04720 [Lautropia sp.]
MSLLAFLLSLVLEHFRPVLPAGSPDAACSEPPGADPAAGWASDAAGEGAPRRAARQTGSGAADGTAAEGAEAAEASGGGAGDGSSGGVPGRTKAGGSPAGGAGGVDASAADASRGTRAEVRTRDDATDDEVDADLDDLLARMADETPEPDPFGELPPAPPLPLDPDLASRARMQDDRAAFVPTSHPWFAPVSRLVDWATPEAIDETDAPPMGWGGWCIVVGLPAAAVVTAQWVLSGFGALGVLAVLALHVWVLWHGVLAGRLRRRLDRLFVLAGTLDDDAHAARQVAAVVGRWVPPSGGTAAPARDEREIARLALSSPLLDAYRDVFAPLFWYLLLPGASGPVLTWCARVAASRRGGVAFAGLRLLDWLPLRLAAFGFALGGRFDDAVFGLRSSHAAAGAEVAIDHASFDARPDPGADQRLMLLPAAGGALGVDILDEASRQRLRAASADVATDAVEPTLARVAAVRALLMRCAGAWAAIVVAGWWLW